MQKITEISQVNISDLQPYERNSRIHSEIQIEQIKNSINQWGWTIPILIDENNVVLAGHARLEAGKQLNIDQVPCMIAKDWTEQQKQAYIIADNKLAENSTWDMGLFYTELKKLNDDGFDLKFIGVDDNFDFNFNGECTPNIDFSDVNQSDIDRAQDKQNEIGNTDIHVQKVICPKCMYEFEISGNN